MTFKQWFKKNFKAAKFGSCAQDEGIKIGWLCCKEEVLKLLEELKFNLKDEKYEFLKKEIEKRL